MKSLFMKLSLFAVICILAMVDMSAENGPGHGYASVPKDAYAVIAEIQAKPGKAAELRTATLPLLALVRRDPKNLVYFFQEDRERPGHFLFYEVYLNEADFNAHNNQPYVKAWFAKLPALAEGGVKLTRMAIEVQPEK